jgi:hypothetical protein
MAIDPARAKALFDAAPSNGGAARGEMTGYVRSGAYGTRLLRASP